MPAQYWTCRKSVFCRNGWTNRAGFLLEKRLQVDPRDLHENSTFSKNKGTSLWNSVPKSGLRENFATAIRLSQRVAILARQRWTLPR